MRRFLVIIAVLAATLGVLAGWGYAEACADPVVRHTRIALPDWPAGQAPVRVVLISDVHVGSATMDATRLARIVKQIDALSPDLVLIAGDFVYGHDPHAAIASARALRAPLAGLHARLGAVAVLGNHDHWTQAALIRRELEAAGVTVLHNTAVARGPLAIGGAGDLFSRHDDVPAMLTATRSVAGARIVLTHSPDLAPKLPPALPLLFAGHTHCGQVVLPFYGPVTEVSAARYRCGVVREPGRTTIVTAGLGTSGPPLRYGAPPDLWLVTLGPARRR